MKMKPLYLIKVVVWTLVVIFCALCTFEVLPLAGPRWSNWVVVACGFAAAVIEAAGQRTEKAAEAGKLASSLVFLGGLLIILGGLWTPSNMMDITAAPAPEPTMGIADWVVIVLLYLNLAIGLVQKFLEKKDDNNAK